MNATVPAAAEAATRSADLVVRASANQQFGQADFTAWSRDVIGSLRFRRVLDLCCGTGNQLVLYADAPEVTQLVGIDVSGQALETARQRLAANRPSIDLTLLEADIDACPRSEALVGQSFDLISCFYGLYYARDPAAVIDGLSAKLAGDGAFLVVGPYGDNNRSIFDLIRRHYPLPAPVVESSSTFMTETLLPHLKSRFVVDTRTFVNTVGFPSAEEVLRYWTSTTFHDPRYTDAVTRDLEDHFRDHSQFFVEKHVMTIIAAAAEPTRSEGG